MRAQQSIPRITASCTTMHLQLYLFLVRSTRSTHRASRLAVETVNSSSCVRPPVPPGWLRTTFYTRYLVVVAGIFLHTTDSLSHVPTSKIASSDCFRFDVIRLNDENRRHSFQRQEKETFTLPYPSFLFRPSTVELIPSAISVSLRTSQILEWRSLPPDQALARHS